MTSNSTQRPVERHCDVAVVGGSSAGLAAALQLGRQRRSVIVVDAGEPRNAPAAHVHGYLGHEGLPPAELLRIARAEVRSYGGEILGDRATGVFGAEDDGFRVDLASGHVVVARKVIAATGLVDELPDIEGLADGWGRDVIHCPFCHGFEARDQRLVQIVTHPMGLHQAGLFRQLTEQLTAVLHAGVDADSDEVRALRDAGVEIIHTPVRRVLTENGRVTGVELVDGGCLEAETVVVGPRFRARVEPFAPLGLVATEHPTGLGEVLETDAMGATSVPGVYAAGNVTDPSQQVLHAAAHGSRVGAMVAAGLAHEDIAAATRTSGPEADRDRRYRSGPVLSRNPNPTLVAEIGGMPPGRALDVGAGESADAIWLAGGGWVVTANDISQRALDRIQAEALSNDLQVTSLLGDANAMGVFEHEAFDLVTAHHASIPRTPDNRAAHQVVDAVKPGGTLLVVAHDHEPLRGRAGGAMAFDADALVRIEDYLAALDDRPGWNIEVTETRPRPPQPGAEVRHAADLVLRAHRHGHVHASSAPHEFDKSYWESHWRSASAVEPEHAVAANPYLERELADLQPRTALDAGCGEGAEAIWLARRDWTVVAADISAEALSRARQRAGHIGAGSDRLRWIEADLSTWNPAETFDLVMTSYAHSGLPQLDLYERISGWVASHGTLLIVGHRHTYDHRDENGPPAEASVTAATVAERLDPTEWEIVTADEPTRTVTRKGRSTELRDVVVRAVRRR